MAQRFSVERFVRNTTKNLKDERWQPVLLSLAAISAVAATYQAYTEIRTKGMGEDDLFPDLASTIQEMIKAKRHPTDVFYFLPETRLRAQALIGGVEALRRERDLELRHSPLLHAVEHDLLGGLYLQRITLEFPGTVSSHGDPERTSAHAIVGYNYSLSYPRGLDEPQRGREIDRIVRMYPPGARALEARRNITGV